MTSQATIAPFYLARVGGVSAASLDGLSLTRTVEAIRAAQSAASEMSSLEPVIDQLLYRLVPRCGDDQEQRRRVLRVKRHVHNSRVWPEAAADVERVVAQMADEPQREVVQQWFRLA